MIQIHRQVCRWINYTLVNRDNLLVEILTEIHSQRAKAEAEGTFFLDVCGFSLICLLHFSGRSQSNFIFHFHAVSDKKLCQIIG